MAAKIVEVGILRGDGVQVLREVDISVGKQHHFEGVLDGLSTHAHAEERLSVVRCGPWQEVQD